MSRSRKLVKSKTNQVINKVDFRKQDTMEKESSSKKKKNQEEEKVPEVEEADTSMFTEEEKYIL